ncbi:MAG: hypothetical protein ACOVQ7_10035 [Limnoraphis robusta]
MNNSDKFVRVKSEIAERVEVFREQQGLSNFTEAMRVLVLRGLNSSGISSIKPTQPIYQPATITPMNEPDEDLDTSLTPDELMQNLFN